MKNNVKTISSKLFKKQRLVITALLALVFVGMSVGYAVFNQDLFLDSTISLAPIKGLINDLDITKAATMSGSYYTGNVSFEKVKTGPGINFNVNMTSNLGCRGWLRYELTVVNRSNYPYTYMGSDAVYSYGDSDGTTYPIKYPVITGMLKGDVIGPGETKKIYVSFTSDMIEGTVNNLHQLTAKLILSFEIDDKNMENPKFMGTLIDNEVVINEHKNATAKFKILNMFDCSQVVRFYIDNNELELLNPAGYGIAQSYVSNKNGNDELGAAIRVKRMTTDKEEYTTKLYGKVLLEAEGKEITFEIGTITIKTTGTPTTPAATLSNISISGSFKSFLNLANRRSSEVKLTNNNNFEIPYWVIRANINKEPAVSQATVDDGGVHMVDFDTTQDQLMIYSYDLSGTRNENLGAKSTINIGNFSLTLTGVKTNLGLIKTYYEPKFESFSIDAYYNGEWHYGIPVN